MLVGHKNSKKQGDVGMGLAVGWFAAQGHTVSLPLTDSQAYDLVVDMNGALKKVQVKTTYHKNPGGFFSVSLRTCGGNRSGTTVKHFDCLAVDYLFVLTNDKSMYLIPSVEISNKSSLDLGAKAASYRVIF